MAQEIDHSINELLNQLKEKYNQTGQDLASNLEGLLYQDYLKYWDYIQTDTLLSLQKPQTGIPDEMVFIIYHQITELYFKLILWEMGQIVENNDLNASFFIEKLKRINRYFEMLTHSFEIMAEGMDVIQFRKFRMALLPASGFQSAQYRLIEIHATDFYQLTDKEYKDQFNVDSDTDEIYRYIYWNKGATELTTGKKTITLIHFEEKYGDLFKNTAKKLKLKNLWRRFLEVSEKKNQIKALKEELRSFDEWVNIKWPLAHLKSAAKYLKPEGKAIAATGGTNWTKYLPPKFQRRIFYPELWSEAEINSWGMKLE